MAPNYTVSYQRLWCTRLFGVFTIKTRVLTPRASCVDVSRDSLVPIEGTHSGVLWAFYVTEGLRHWRYRWPVSRLRMSWRFIRTEWETRLRDDNTRINMELKEKAVRLWIGFLCARLFKAGDSDVTPCEPVSAWQVASIDCSVTKHVCHAPALCYHLQGEIRRTATGDIEVYWE